MRWSLHLLSLALGTLALACGDSAPAAPGSSTGSGPGAGGSGQGGDGGGGGAAEVFEPWTRQWPDIELFSATVDDEGSIYVVAHNPQIEAVSLDGVVSIEGGGTSLLAFAPDGAPRSALALEGKVGTGLPVSPTARIASSLFLAEQLAFDVAAQEGRMGLRVLALPSLEGSRQVITSGAVVRLAAESLIVVDDQLWLFVTVAGTDYEQRIQEVKLDGVTVLDPPPSTVLGTAGEEATFRLRLDASGALLDATWWTMEIPALRVGNVFARSDRQPNLMLSCSGDGSCSPFDWPASDGLLGQIIPGNGRSTLWVTSSVPLDPAQGGADHASVVDWFDLAGTPLGQASFDAVPGRHGWYGASFIDASDRVWDMSIDGWVTRIDSSGEVARRRMFEVPELGFLESAGWVERPGHGMIAWTFDGHLGAIDDAF